MLMVVRATMMEGGCRDAIASGGEAEVGSRTYSIGGAVFIALASVRITQQQGSFSDAQSTVASPAYLQEASWSCLHVRQGSSVFTHQSSETIFAVVYVIDESSKRVSRSLLRWTAVVDAATGGGCDVEEW